MKRWQVSRIYILNIRQSKYVREPEKFNRQLDLVYERYNLPKDKITDEITVIKIGYNGEYFIDDRFIMRIEVLKRVEEKE